MKSNLILLVTAAAVVVAVILLLVVFNGNPSPKTIPDADVPVRITDGWPKVYRVEYQGAVYLVTGNGGIIRHTPRGD